LERADVNRQIGEFLRDLCRDLKLPYIFKASLDKANRSSIHSDRGPGLEAGRDELARLRHELGVPVTTDVHDASQPTLVADIVDLLQVPAFLCRQTDLLIACARTGRPVNVKKGQFMAPSEMKNVVTKLEESGASGIMLTERGTFFGYHRLVNDFAGLGEMMEIGPPVCFDVTHSTQYPGAGGTTTAGQPQRAPLLARAAVAAGVDALFLECHPNPAEGRSDQSTMLPFDVVESLLRDAATIWRAVRESQRATVGEEV